MKRKHLWEPNIAEKTTLHFSCQCDTIDLYTPVSDIKSQRHALFILRLNVGLKSFETSSSFIAKNLKKTII